MMIGLTCRASVCIPLHTVSEANRRGHWRKHAARHAAQRRAAGAHLWAVRESPVPVPVLVELTRIAPRALDGDNLQGALKHVRDGVADWLGIDDGDARITWTYAQERGRPREYAVRIEVFA